MSKATMRDARIRMVRSCKVIASGLNSLFFSLNYFRLAFFESMLASLCWRKMPYSERRGYIRQARELRSSSSSQ